MITKNSLVDQYRKYLEVLKKEDADVVQCYSKLTELFKKCSDSSLTATLQYDAIHNTLVQVEKRDIKLLYLKNYGAWTKESVSESWELIHQFCKTFRECYNYKHDTNYCSKPFAGLWNTIGLQPVHVKLYLCLALKNQIKKSINDEKYEFFAQNATKVKKLLTAKTEEEIDRILTVQPSEEELVKEAEAPSTTTAETLPDTKLQMSEMDWWKLWRLFTNDTYTLVTNIRENAEGKTKEELQTAATKLIKPLEEKWKDIHTYKDKEWEPAASFKEYADQEVKRLLGVTRTPTKTEAEMAIENILTEYN